MTKELVYAMSGEYICTAERLSLYGFNDINGIKDKKRRQKEILKVSKKLIDLREKEREESNLIEYQEYFRNDTVKTIDYDKALAQSNKKKQVSIGGGLVIDID